MTQPNASAPAAARSASTGAPALSAMPLVQTADGTALFFKDWGTGRPAVFIASWGLNSDMWQYQTAAMVDRGIRCIAYDRRGHGRSSQPGRGYDCDTLAGDLAAVMNHLDLKDAVLIGHSMAACEIVRYLSRHGSSRVSRIVLIAPTTPFFLKTPDNPGGIPEEFIEQARAQWRRDFPKWLADNSPPFFVPETSPAMKEWVLSLMRQTALKALLDCNYAMVHTDFRAELPKIALPALIIHGDRDASTPLELTGRRTAELIPDSRLEVYEGAPHGLMFTHADRLTRDLLEFAIA